MKHVGVHTDKVTIDDAEYAVIRNNNHDAQRSEWSVFSTAGHVGDLKVNYRNQRAFVLVAGVAMPINYFEVVDLDDLKKAAEIVVGVAAYVR